MLEELSALLDMNWQYLAFLLRNTGRVVMRKGRIVVVLDPCVENASRRGRKKVYTHNVLEALKKILRDSLPPNIWWPSFSSIKRCFSLIRLVAGGKVRKIYDMDTPLKRILQQPNLSCSTREKLLSLKKSIDIVSLSRK